MIDVVLRSRALVGESPVWDDRTQTLIWVDILASEFHRCDPARGEDIVHNVGTHVGAAVLTSGVEVLLAVRDGFSAFNEQTGALTSIALVETRSDHRMNDGAVDSAGRFLAGTMGYEPQPGSASLYALEPDLSVRELLSGLGLSNGLGWSPADDLFYFIDSLTHRVVAYPWDRHEGIVGDARIVVEIDAALGLPDGLSVDVDGCLWVGLFGGGAVNRYTPEGQLDRRIDIPTSGVTCPELGGTDGRTLFVATSSYGMTPQELAGDPLAGALFATSVSTPGLPVSRFQLQGGEFCDR